MKNYVFSGVDSSGRRVRSAVSARNARAALDRIALDGYTDVELHSDDLNSTECDSAGPPVRPELLAELNNAGPAQAYLLCARETYRQLWVAFVALAGWLALRRVQGAEWSAIDTTLTTLLVLPALLPALQPHVARYTRLQVAVLRADWREVRRLSEQLTPALSRIGADGELELTYWRARAMLGLGQRQEAYDELNALRVSQRIPIGRLLWRIASLQMAEDDYAAARASLEQAVEHQPDDPMLWVALAELLGSRLNEPAAARQAAERARSFPLSAQTRDALDCIAANIALCEGRYEEARSGLEKAIAKLRRQETRTPIARGVRHVMEAALVVACARSGDVSAAQRAYAACCGFLKLHKSAVLLGRAEAALHAAGAA